MREYLEMEIPGRGLVRADRNPETWPNRDGGCGFVPHWALVADPDQPRTYFDPDELAELGESIKTEGQREILTVDLLTDVERELYAQKNAVPRYILVSGERRWRASGPGYADLPLVEIRLRRYENPDDRHLDAVLLNESRVDLAPLDRARQYARLLEGRCRGNKSLLCKMIGRSPPDVDGYLSLNNLSPLAKDAMHPSRKKEALKYGTALVLAKLHASLQDNFVPRIMAGEAGRTSTEQRRWIAIQLVNRGGPGANHTHMTIKASHLREKLEDLPISILPRINLINGMPADTFATACEQIGIEELPGLREEYTALAAAIAETIRRISEHLGSESDAEPNTQEAGRTPTTRKTRTSSAPVPLSGMIRADYYKPEGGRRTKLTGLMVSLVRYVQLYEQSLLAWQVEGRRRPEDQPDPEEVKESLVEKV